MFCFFLIVLLLTSGHSVYLATVIVINVDVDFPEQNREIKVVPFNNVVQDDGVLHDGFDLMMDCDVHDFLNGRYKAELVPGSNKVLITMPSASHTYLHGFGSFFDELKKSPEDYCACAELGHDIVRNAIIAGDEARKTKKLLLCFPEHIVLSTRHYCKAGASKTELKSDMIPFETKFKWYDEDIVRGHDVVFWKVAIHEEEPRIKTLPQSDESKEAAKLLARLKSMSMRPWAPFG